MNNKMPGLAEAKAKFVSSAVAADPLKIVRKSPFKSIGLVFCAGVVMGFSESNVSRKLFPFQSILASLLKKLI